MGSSAALFLLPCQVKQPLSRPRKRSLGRPRTNRSVVPVARLFGPAIFEASKLKVLFLGVDEEKHPGKLPRAYTLTHSDISSELTLAISDTINRSQVLKAFVHGDGNLLNNHPELEEALVWVYFHSNLPEFNRVECWGPLREAANHDQATSTTTTTTTTTSSSSSSNWVRPQPCQMDCNCCFPPFTLIPWPHDHHHQESGVEASMNPQQQQ
ncbi:hypothetical protein QJS10_CPB15g00719 [Acorus calamus]|uniref:Staygreen protein domain-containing protein n=1 Tax=Acorus calamus TaxID=4465 RepID=A0AAV9D410_ACOCL|nr:hypothetical protein QJS10_CPB15g00719 [Acorus calamus]